VKTKNNEEAPTFHRLTIDLTPALYAKLLALAKQAERSASKQAKFMLQTLLTTEKGKPK